MTFLLLILFKSILPLPLRVCISFGKRKFEVEELLANLVVCSETFTPSAKFSFFIGISILFRLISSCISVL